MGKYLGRLGSLTLVWQPVVDLEKDGLGPAIPAQNIRHE